MEKYMNYVAEKADQGIQYTETVAEKADQGIQYAESIAEKSEKMIEFSNYLSKNMDKLAQHNDYLTEGLNNVVAFADYLKENLETVGGYSNYVGENLDKLNKRLSGVNEEGPTAQVATQKAAETIAVPEATDYKKSITEKLQILIESAQKQTAVPTGDMQFLNFLNDDKKAQYQSLNEIVKNELVQAYSSS
jgi:hypothetical protein